MTHDLMTTMLDGLGAEVERMVINDVEESTFFARLILSMENELGHKIIEPDARPERLHRDGTDAQKPIYVTRKYSIRSTT